MIKKIYFLAFFFGISYSCSTKTNVDLIVKNAVVYTVNPSFDRQESFAIKDGNFIAVGNSETILKKYKSTKIIDAEGQTILPGLIDAHCHFYGLGLQQQKIDLTGTKSFNEVLEKLVTYKKLKNVSYITGRGWDQNDWEITEYPTKEKLDQLFPKTPVAVRRVDGHAILVNQAAINLSNINVNSKIEGGQILIKNGKLTGVFIDNAMDLIKIPKPTKKDKILALLDAQKICFNLGLTTVDDAGIDREIIELIDSLQQTGDLKMRIYAMVLNTKSNLDYYLKKGIIKTDKLNVRSIKVVADGALGSRGATLKETYSDQHNHFGTLVTNYKDLQNVAKRIANSNYQMNTHAIGDSAISVTLKAYTKYLKEDKTRRWRLEHAQVMDPKEFGFYKNILPSVQPTHATSDMYWAEDRVGKERIKSSYAYKQLLDQYGKIALGTDFPVEKANPMHTFYASVARKDLKHFPENGFQKENALSRENTLRGMTIWAAYSNFEEHEKGSIEVGKLADFIILDKDIMKITENKIPQTKVIDTYISGNKVN
jgi:predicted amidohydrolase YtcJ